MSEASDTGDTARKLAAARTRLALERPFLGALVMHLPLVASETVRTIGTDARAIYFNARFIDGLAFAATQFVLAHEALHCALGHFHRGRGRLRARWDRACDYCVNQLLADDGLTPPPGALLKPAFRGMAAEEIYAVLDDGEPGAPLDEHFFGGVPAAGPAAALAEAGWTPNESLADEAFLAAHRDGFDEIAARASTLERLDAAWQDRLASAASEAAQAGRLGAAFRAACDRLVQPRLPWRALLARFLMTAARDDYSFQRPGRRSDTAMLPGLASATADLVVAVDTSGSIGGEALSEFLGEIDALKGQLGARVALLACDAALAPESPWRFEAWEPIELPPDLAGGGGTRFTPVFEWIDDQAMRPDALLYFTDAQGEFPPQAPDYPVLWLVKGNAPVPWGERVQLN
jgi:predicted metal-dependent peptidase